MKHSLCGGKSCIEQEELGFHLWALLIFDDPFDHPLFMFPREQAILKYLNSQTNLYQQSSGPSPKGKKTC